MENKTHDQDNLRDDAVRVVIMQVMLADYRKQLFELLIQHLKSDLLVLTGKKEFSGTIVSGLNLGRNMMFVQNMYMFQGKALIQRGAIGPCVKAKVAVLVLDPHIISVWIVLLVRKILGRRSVLWGHAWPRSGKNSGTDFVRGWMRSLADAIIVYTETEAAELSVKMPNKTIVAACNALYSKKVMRPAQCNNIPRDFIYVGRLVPEKKPELLLEAFAIIVEELPDTCNLVFVGAGPSQLSLVGRASELGLTDRIRFTGHIGDIEQLKELYSRSVASVSPGYVGLSLTQSLGFGVPMIVADNEPHAPEVEAAREGENMRFFIANSPESLGTELLRFSNEADTWYEKREAISKDCRDRYSCEAMVTAFIIAIDGRQTRRRQ